MPLDYETFAQAVVAKLAAEGGWHRAVSIDLETKIEKRSDFLSGERLLGIGFARRVGKEVETRTIRLKDDTDEAEVGLLEEAARYLHPIRPLLLLGYNITGYDYPLLALKVKWYDERARAAVPEGTKPVFPREYWTLKDALTRAFVVDMMHSLRYDLARHDGNTPKYRSLSYSVQHPKFASVPLMRRKGLADADAQADKGNQMSKGKKIYEMWKSHDPGFERYLEGDVHDVLLLAEEIYGVKKGA